MKDWHERLKTEAFELELKIVKLNDFLFSAYSTEKLSIQQRHLLQIQSDAMNTYLSILMMRLDVDEGL